MPLYEINASPAARNPRSGTLRQPPLAACSKRGGEVKKLLSSPAFQFKGSGFDATDVGGKKGGEPSAGGKSEGGGESEAQVGVGRRQLRQGRRRRQGRRSRSPSRRAPRPRSGGQRED